MFVGSAGAYNADPIEPMHVEGDARKSSAGHVAVEKHLASSGIPYTVFQPQYIYGPHTAKDCEQWFVERAIRQRPTPIPGPGIQLTTLTHVEDIASMMAAVRPPGLHSTPRGAWLSTSFAAGRGCVETRTRERLGEPEPPAQVVGNTAAHGQHYNAVSDRCISFDGIAKVVASALGQEPNIVHYDPAKVWTGLHCSCPTCQGTYPRTCGLVMATEQPSVHPLRWLALTASWPQQPLSTCGLVCRSAWARARASPSARGTFSPRPARPRPSWAGSRSTPLRRTSPSSWRPTGPAGARTRTWTFRWTTRSWRPRNNASGSALQLGRADSA